MEGAERGAAVGVAETLAFPDAKRAQVFPPSKPPSNVESVRRRRDVPCRGTTFEILRPTSDRFRLN